MNVCVFVYMNSHTQNSTSKNVIIHFFLFIGNVFKHPKRVPESKENTKLPTYYVWIYADICMLKFNLLGHHHKI